MDRDLGMGGPRVELCGIVNVTADSFSDGGRYLAPEAAIAHAERLVAEGARWIDVGAESSHPQAAPVPEALQIARLGPVVRHLAAAGIPVSVDTHRPAVMQAVLDLGAGMINDITALGAPGAAALLARYPEAKVVLMFARNAGPRAEVQAQPHEGLSGELIAFFRARLGTAAAAGIAEDRLILDPGMSFFLGSTPEPSLWALKHLPALAALGRPLYVSTSRKSFIGAVLGGRPAEGRGAGTLATELWAAQHGARYVRTHDVRALADALALWQAIDGVGG